MLLRRTLLCTGDKETLRFHCPRSALILTSILSTLAVSNDICSSVDQDYPIDLEAMLMELNDSYQRIPFGSRLIPGK